MNLFARILSHGFALIVVALLAIGLIYRGELFPGMELPDFLSFERTSDGDGEGPAGMVSRSESAHPGVAAPEEGAGVPADAEILQDAGTVAPEVAQGAVDTAGETVSTVEAPVAAAVPVDVPGESVTVETKIVDEDSVPARVAATVEDTTGIPQPSPQEIKVITDEVPAPADVVREEVAAGLPDIPAASEEPSLPATIPAPDDAQAASAADSIAAQEDVAAGTAQDDVAADTASVPAGVNRLPDTGPSETQQPAAATTAETPAESPYQLLAAAREAYWLRDYATAEQKYQAMIDLDPNNPDGYGELGNMYFSQGKWTLASASYFEAGKRLADEGLLEQARQLVNVLKGLQGPQAGELEDYIAGKASTNQ